MSECAFFVTHGEAKSQILLNTQCIWDHFSPVAENDWFIDKFKVEVTVNES